MEKNCLQEDDGAKNVCGDIYILKNVCRRLFLIPHPSPPPHPTRGKRRENVIAVVIQYYDVSTRIS